MDWKDIEVAAAPVNAAYTANQLLGHAILLLEKEVQGLPFTAPNRAHAYSELARRVVCIADAIWNKHLRRRQDGDVAVVESMELVLAKVEAIFMLGLGHGPLDVLDEDRFHGAAERICHVKGVWLPGTFALMNRYWHEPTDEEIATDWTTLRQNPKRCEEFESMDATQWIHQSAGACNKRAPWVRVAETWASLSQAIEKVLTTVEPSPTLLRPAL